MFSEPSYSTGQVFGRSSAAAGLEGRQKKEALTERLFVIDGPALLGRAIHMTYAAAEAFAPVGTSAIVFRICEAIW